MKGIITDIHRTSLVDGPGIRTTVFIKGCPLRCIWCHNPETQSIQIESEYGREVDVDSVVNECLKDKIYYNESNGGVTLSGGEPLMQAEFSIELLRKLKNDGIHTAIDTCGYIEKKALKRSLNLTDLYLYDYKLSNPSKHKDMVKGQLQPILENLEFLLDNQANVILRCPIIPSLNDDVEHLTAISEMENKYPSLIQIDILPWHNMGKAKYKKLGLVKDPRLPNENAGEDRIQDYKEFFLKRGNKKVVVR